MRFSPSNWLSGWLLAALFTFLPALGQAQHGACVPRERGCFVDASGAPRKLDDAYRTLHLKPRRRGLIALGEEALFLGIGTTWYWLDASRNSADWDNPALKARFTAEVLRFDNNTFPINFMWHPFSGVAFYAFPRANDLTAYEAIGLAGLTSFLWEYGLEFREKISINDLISTPLAGAAMGEFFSRLAFYVNRPVRTRGARQKLYGWLLGPSQAFHDIRIAPSATGPADEYGLMADLHHRFELYGGYGAIYAQRGRNDVAELGFRGRFVAIPSYGRVGKVRKFFHDADVTSMSLHTSVGDRPLEFDWRADTTFVGLYTQNIQDTPEGRLGGSLLVGTGLGYRYRRLRYAGFHDDFHATHLPGLSIDATGHSGGITLSLIARLTPDFVGLSSDALNVIIGRGEPGLQTKTVAERYGYVYGFGGSGRIEGTIEVPHVRFGARMMLARYKSAEGVDRNQEELTRDIEAEETLRTIEAFLAASPWPTRRLSLELSLREERRSSKAEEVERRQRLMHYGVGVRLVL